MKPNKQYVAARRAAILDRQSGQVSIGISDTGQSRHLRSARVDRMYSGVRNHKPRNWHSQGRPEMRTSPFYANAITVDSRWDR